MSIALKFGDAADANSISGVIYFDAVTDYSKEFSGRVTEHPIEAGASVSDHFISANPKYRISGVISSVDLSGIPSQIMLEGQKPLNANPQPDAVTVSNIGSTLRQYLPGIVTQFLSNALPSAIGGIGSRTDHRDAIINLFEEMLSGLYYNEARGKWENRMTPTTLYEVTGSQVGKSVQDLIVTSFQVSEDADSGDALFIEMSLEQVKFVTLEKAEAPKAAKGSTTEKGTSPTKNKGNATKTTDTPSAPAVNKAERATVNGSIKKGNEAAGRL